MAVSCMHNASGHNYRNSSFIVDVNAFLVNIILYPQVAKIPGGGGKSKVENRSYYYIHCRMSFQDFSKNFSKLEICNLGPDSVTDTTKKRFEMTAHEGCWKRRVNAGGCRNYISQYHSLSASATASQFCSSPYTSLPL